MSKKEKTKQRPQALNTVEMLRVASSALGKFTPIQASLPLFSFVVFWMFWERICAHVYHHYLL